MSENKKTTYSIDDNSREKGRIVEQLIGIVETRIDQDIDMVKGAHVKWYNNLLTTLTALSIEKGADHIIVSPV